MEASASLEEMVGRYEELCWASEDWYGESGRYRPYVPDSLMETEFNIDAEATALVARATEDLTRLDLGAGSLAFSEPLARMLMRSEALASSRIEGMAVPAGRVLEMEALDGMGVRHRADGVEAAVIANVGAMEGTVSRVGEGDEVTVEMMCEANRVLLADGPLADRGGAIRGAQNWVGGSDWSPVGASYVPPRPELVAGLLDDLARFVNSSGLPTVAKAAVAHAQFETIHPFADGNGRTGRALVQMVLRADGLCTHTYAPVSLELATHRGAYIAQLEAFRVDDGITEGATRDLSGLVGFFSRAAGASCSLALGFESSVASIERGWRERLGVRKGSAADLLLGALASCPVVNARTASGIIGRSEVACRNALERLAEAGIVTQNARNRKSSLWVADEILSEFTSLERAYATPGGDTREARPARATPQRRNLDAAQARREARGTPPGRGDECDPGPRHL